MNPDFAAFAIPTLKEFYASLGLPASHLNNRYTPNKLLRQYLRETTWFYPWARESGDDILYDSRTQDMSQADIEAEQRGVEETRKLVSTTRTANMWTALLFGATFGRHAAATQLYSDFNTSVLERSGISVAGQGSNCSLGTRTDNTITPWQQMVFFYLAGEGPRVIKTVLKSLHILLSNHAMLLLPLNMAAFVVRMQKTLSRDAIANEIRTVTLDADYPIIAELIMNDLIPSPDREVGEGPNPGILDRRRRLSLPDPSAQAAEGIIYIGPEGGPERRQVIVGPNEQGKRPRPSLAMVAPNSVTTTTRPLDVVRWTVVEEELFALDDTWTRFKQVACLSPVHPARATIRVYLACLPRPKVLIPHHKFVMDVMPYCDVSAVAKLTELVEFCRLFEDGWTWPAAKIVTRLIWTYDPYSTGAVDSKMAAYLRKYPKLTTETICGLLPPEFDKVYK